MKLNNDEQKNMGSRLTEEHWEAAAIAVAISAALFGLFASFWMMGYVGSAAADFEAVRARASIVTTVGGFLIAVVTFCTVAWRAKVTERKANAQEAQLASADENNLALLLQKGAELINDEKKSNVAVGIACLEAVATANNKKFGNQAMRLLGQHLHDHYADGLTGDHCIQTLDALKAGYRNGNISEQTLTVRNWNPRTPQFGPWIPGIRNVIYEQCHFWGTRIQNPPHLCQFRNCRFEASFPLYMGATHDFYFEVIGCIFERCIVESFNAALIPYNKFFNCDFSDADIDFSSPFREPDKQERAVVATLAKAGNSYRKRQPPKLWGAPAYVDTQELLDAFETIDA